MNKAAAYLHKLTKEYEELRVKVDENGARSSMLKFMRNMKVLHMRRDAIAAHPETFPEPYRELLEEKINELERIVVKAYLPPPVQLSGRVLRSGKVC